MMSEKFKDASHYALAQMQARGQNMNRTERDGVAITYDNRGQKYFCSICGWTANRLECRAKGWGKAQRLRKLVREHIESEHN